MKRSDKKMGELPRSLPGDDNIFVYTKKYLPLAAALLLFLMSAGFIFIKLIGAKRDSDRWSDYDECGIF
jgi:hypothetical protein